VPDRLKQLLTGCGLGLLSALFLWGVTTWQGSFLTRVVDSYEYRSYDARFRARTSESHEESIDTVLGACGKVYVRTWTVSDTSGNTSASWRSSIDRRG